MPLTTTKHSKLGSNFNSSPPTALMRKRSASLIAVIIWLDVDCAAFVKYRPNAGSDERITAEPNASPRASGTPSRSPVLLPKQKSAFPANVRSDGSAEAASNILSRAIEAQVAHIRTINLFDERSGSVMSETPMMISGLHMVQYMCRKC